MVWHLILHLHTLLALQIYLEEALYLSRTFYLSLLPVQNSVPTQEYQLKFVANIFLGKANFVSFQRIDGVFNISRFFDDDSDGLMTYDNFTKLTKYIRAAKKQSTDSISVGQDTQKNAG